MTNLHQVQPLLDTARMLASVAQRDELAGQWPSFELTVAERAAPLSRRRLTTLQVNLGKLCNQKCRHCHVEAGPQRTEQMTRATAVRVVELMELAGSEDLALLDITGGAPELNANFRFLVERARARGLRVIDRCNLTVLFEAGQEDTAVFLRDNQVDIVASLPCYSRENVEKQRGEGVFAKSIKALQILNELGYGQADSERSLDLVYNPVGPSLPPAQAELEAEYKERLGEDFGIVFNGLYTITNMPIKRFLYDLKHSAQLDDYMNLLVDNFNPDNAEDVMCRDLISIGWQGELSDCDFNQMLDIPVPRAGRTIWEIESLEDFSQGSIAVADHCFGCTAGAGSSCGGQLS
jgi:radical SAM/Cys-rich protein